MTDAQTAEYAEPGHWLLHNVVKTVLDGDHSRVESSQAGDWHSTVTPGLLSVLLVTPERMSLYGLLNYTRHLTENKQKPSAMKLPCGKN